MTARILLPALMLILLAGLVVAGPFAVYASGFPGIYLNPSHDGPAHCWGRSNAATPDPCASASVGGKPIAEVNTYNGNLTVSDMPVYYQSIGDAIPFTIHYNRIHASYCAEPRPMNAGWTHSYNIFVKQHPGPDDPGAFVNEGNGWLHWYVRVEGSATDYISPVGVFDTLVGNQATGWVLTRPDGHTLYFRADGRLVSIQDRDGLTWSMTYESIGGYDQLTAITDPCYRQTTLTYDLYGNKYLLRRVTVPGGLYAEFDYDPGVGGQGPISITDAAGDTYGISYFEDQGDAIKSITDRTGREVNFTYGSWGPHARQAVMSTFITGLANSTVTYSYSQHGTEQWTDITQISNGETVRHVYDNEGGSTTSYGALLRIERDPGNPPHLNLVQTWRRDSQLRVVRYRDCDTWDSEPGGKEHRDWFYYEDAANPGRVTRFVDAENYDGPEPPPPGWDDPNCPAYRYQYDSLGNLTKITTPEDRVTDLTYVPGTNRLSSVIVRDTDRNGNQFDHTTSFTYWDAAGYYQLKTITDARGNVTTICYDANGYPDYVDLPGGYTPPAKDVDFTANAVGDITAVTDGNGNTTYYSYDGLHRVTQITYPDTGAGVKTKTFTWTCCGLDLVVNENGVQLKNEYDFYTKRLWKVHEDFAGLNYVTEFGYDGVGNLKTVKNARSYTTTYTYDAADRCTRVDYPDSTYETWTYHTDDRIHTHTDQRGRTTTYRYDADHRLCGPAGSGYVAINYPNDTDVNIGRDLDGLVTAFTDASGSTGVDYYLSGWVKTVTNGVGKTVSYDYNHMGLVSKLIAPDPTKYFTYGYTDRNQLQYVNDEMGTTQGGFTYDNGGRLTLLTRPGSYIQYQYNARDWLTAVLNRTSGGVTCYDANYYYNDGSLWDFVGNPLKRVENIDGSVRTTTLRYDALSRQLQESRTPNPYSLYYTYDAVGNRASRNYNGTLVTYTYDNNNKLTSASDGSSFGYDYNGNMTGVTGPLGSWSLVYDDESRLTSVTYPGGVDTFLYNALGQRMRGVLGGAIHRYVYNGERVLEDTSDAGATQARYTTASGSYFSPLLHFFTGGDWTLRRYPAYDNVGTARLLLRGNGAITDNYVLDTFGRLIASSGTTPNPYRFGAAWGYITDTPGSGLLQLGARYYWPELGRFVTEDPLGDGVNWYAYAGNNPVLLADPWGFYGETWYMQGMGGLSDAVDRYLTFGRTENYGRVTGLHDVGCASGLDVAWAGAQSGGALASAGFALEGLGAGLVRATSAAGKEFSHWIPARVGRAIGGRLGRWIQGRSLLNGNYVTAAEHALSDPFRFRFMPAAFKDLHTVMPSTLWQQWVRLPMLLKAPLASAGWVSVSSKVSSRNGAKADCDQ